MNSVLIVEDEKVTRLALTRILEKEGLSVIEAANGMQAVELFQRQPPAVVILDIQMPVQGGIDTIRALKTIDPLVPIIIETASGDISTAVETMRLGAYDFLVKPIEPGKLVIAINRALERHRMERELSRLHTAENASLERFVGRSPAMKRIGDQLKQVAASDFSVVIQGETGSGKTLLARILHNISGRADRPFVKIDLGTMPETIIEGELFGYEKGAFTGADQLRKGFFESANSGTAFLDDLENVSPFVQSKLLSVIEGREVFRLGSRKGFKLDIRFIAASNVNMQRSIREGRFREDLFFRLGEFIITLPPLRERTEDIPFFIERFCEAASSELNVPCKTISRPVMNRLLSHAWPGNLRELKNVIRRATLLSTGGQIELDDIEHILGTGSEIVRTPSLMPLRDAVSMVEKEMITKAFAAAKGNRARTAELLQIDVKTLRAKMQEHGLATTAVIRT